MNHRLLQRLDDCMAALDRHLSDDEAAAIYESLRAPVRHPQGRLSLPPPNAGLITGGQPETPRLADSAVRSHGGTSNGNRREDIHRISGAPENQETPQAAG